MEGNLNSTVHRIPTYYDFYYDNLVFNIDQKSGQGNIPEYDMNSVTVVARHELTSSVHSIESFIEEIKKLSLGLDNPMVETETRYGAGQHLIRKVVTGLRKPFPDEVRKIKEYLVQLTKQQEHIAAQRQVQAEQQLASIRRDFPHLI